MWPTFNDADGNEWTLKLTVDLRDVLKEELQFDILALIEKPESLERFHSDDEFLVDCLSLILTDQIERHKMDAHGFARCLFGETLDHATDALIEAISVFSRPRKGAMIRAMWKQTKATMDSVMNQTLERVPAVAQEVERKAMETINQRLEQASK